MLFSNTCLFVHTYTGVNPASLHMVYTCMSYLSMSLYLNFMLLTVVPAAVTDILYKSIHDSVNTSVPVNVSLQWIVSSEAIILHMCISAFQHYLFPSNQNQLVPESSTTLQYTISQLVETILQVVLSQLQSPTLLCY